MDTFAFLEPIREWLVHLREPAAWAQIVMLGLAALGARLLGQHFDRLSAINPMETRLGQLALRTGQRVVFPASMLAGVLVGRALLNTLDLPAELLNVAVPLLLSLAGIRLAIFTLRKTFAPSAALKAWEQIIGTAAWSVVALHFLGWLEPTLTAMDALAFQVGDVRVSLLSLGKMVLLLAVLLTMALWISALAERKLRRATHLSVGIQVGLAKFIKFFLLALAVMGGLNAVGIDLTALAVFGGALGVGLGFGLQRIASNFISGFILIMDRSIRPGDVISVGNSFGWVQELRARYVVVRNRDGVDTLIPNENLITSEVINWSYSDRKVRVRIPVQISYADDPEIAMTLLCEAAKASDRVLADPAPVARFVEFGNNGIGLELRIWIQDPEDGVGVIRSTINLAIYKSFKAHGITIPYPQQELYIKEWPTPRTMNRGDSEAA